MIQGLKITVLGPELRDLIDKRIAYSQERSEFYADKVKLLEGVEMNAGSSVDAFHDLTNKRDQHSREAEELAFIADHLDLGETYLLDRSDMQRLGIVKQGW